MQSRVVLEGKRILITGPAGRIAFPLAAELAPNNEVWGIARFSDPASRQRVEQTGVRTRTVDLADPDFGGLPSEFDYVLHLAAHMEGGLDYDRALRVNAEATGRLMSRFRSARAFLVVSTCGVYEPPRDPAHPIRESDPLGTSSQPYSPTYCISKIAEEAVARFAAREWSIPTTIARMNVAYGPTRGSTSRPTAGTWAISSAACPSSRNARMRSTPAAPTTPGAVRSSAAAGSVGARDCAT